MTSIETLKQALQHAMQNRPKVGGFPYLAETLRVAGVTKNIWQLPSCQSLYIIRDSPVVSQGVPLIEGMAQVLPFDREALITALRTDQNGKSTFPEFLASAWNAGVVRYEVDFLKRHVIYYGASGESYLEEYPAMSVSFG